MKNDKIQMEYVNEKFKEILKINGEISPNAVNGEELLQFILKHEIFEEQI